MPFHRREVIMGGGVFDPTKIAGCVLWLAADKLALTDGASVTTWTDSSGLGHNATQASSVKPVFRVNQIKGQPALVFSSSNVTPMATASAVAQPFTLFVVCTSPGGDGFYLCDGIDGSNRVAIIQNTTHIEVYAGVDDVSSVNWPSGFHVLEFVVKGASSSVSIDGAATLVSQNFGTQGVNGFSVGHRYSSGSLNSCSGSIAEWTVHTSALSTTDRLTLRRGLGTKYGIAVS